MPRGIAKDPTQDKRRLPRTKTGGKTKGDRQRRYFWITKAEDSELRKRLDELREKDKTE